ncbi:MAG: type 4a pilus biogenesis protein PilO [Candidatus Erginobacter occultus]|nr:type 4a pilus biogenesis protein PilO [Candidatus Erginobacter occultus]
MNHTQKAVGIVIGVILLLVMFRLFFYSPISSRLELLQKESGNLDREIAAARSRLTGLSGIEDRIAEARRTLEQLELQYPRSIEVVYQTITTAARETGLKISRRETLENLADEGSALRSYEINIIAYCPYRVLGEFLDKIISSPMLISVSSLTISAETPVGVRSAGNADLRVDMQLTTYLSKGNGA